jgi:hypothetical protein
MRLSPLGTSATNWTIIIAPDDDECGAVSWMRIRRENRSARRKSALLLIGQPQIPHDLTWDRTPANAWGSQIIIVRTMARFCLSISMAVQPFVEPWPLFSFLIFYTVRRTSWAGDQLVARLLPTQTHIKCTTSMPREVFESTITVLERAKPVHP